MNSRISSFFLRIRLMPVHWVAIGFLLLIDAEGTFANGEGSAPWIGKTFGGAPCNGNNPANFGPWDYTRSQKMLPVVHNAHFTPKVEFLRGGENAEGPTNDLDYTIKVCPNHHRALNSALLFHYNDKKNLYKTYQAKNIQSYRLKSPVECYLQRAINYSQNDSIVRMMYASLLHRSGKLDQSLEQYRAAMKLSPNTANIEYNYALLLVDMKMYDEALVIAHKLYGGGFPLPGLKNKLVRANQWK